MEKISGAKKRKTYNNQNQAIKAQTTARTTKESSPGDRYVESWSRYAGL